MGIITWNEKIALGIDSVDRQHRHLIELINRLEEQVTLGEESQAIAKTLSQLTEHVVFHFQHEEELMRNFRYNPERFIQHCRQHGEFINKLQQAQKDLQENTAANPKDFLDFLAEWLYLHAMDTDKIMADSLNQGIDAGKIEIDLDERNRIFNSNLYSALRESENRFKELADNLEALIWVANSNYLPTFCNCYWFKIFGLPSGKIKKDDWLKIIHPEDRDEVMRTYENTANGLTKSQIQYRLYKDGKTTWILETATPRIHKNGNFAGLMGCGMDITNQKKAEHALMKLNQELEQRIDDRTRALITANKTLEIEKNQQTLLNQKLKDTQAHLVQSEKMVSIGQLAAGVAHEINNPLGYIYSNLNTLKQYIQDLTTVAEFTENWIQQLPTDDQRVLDFNRLQTSIDLDFLKSDAADLVNESLEGATRAKKIVQDLRDFSRIDKQERANFDLEAGLNATLNIVNNELKYKAEVVKEYGGLKPFECVGAQLNQVFMNLLVNAAQAIEEYGKITIRTGYQDKDWLWVEVEDTGKGMSDEIKAKIFDPFFTTKPVGKGTGLGLSLSYKIIQDHKGRIHVDSIPGQGTKFRIELPVHSRSDETVAALLP